MQFAQTSSPRSPTGLIVTVAVHAGLVGLALLGTGIVEVPRVVPPPIASRNVPEPPPPLERQVVPRTIEQRIPIAVERPVFDIVEPPTSDTTLTTTTNGTGGEAAATAHVDPVITVDPPAHTGITRRAGLDPRYAADFEAPYPPASIRAGETGTVLVRVVIGPDGRVLRASIARSSGFARLDDAALKRALAKWRFLPAMADGVAVEGTRDVPVTFRLQD